MKTVARIGDTKAATEARRSGSRVGVAAVGELSLNGMAS